jgi:transcriptional regulator GlxA family with amidase domain
MKHISILVPRGAVALGCIEGPHKLFTLINDFLVRMGKPPEFSLHLVGISEEPQKYDSVFAVFPDATIKNTKKTDLIIIPAINGDKQEVLELNQPFIPWMLSQYKQGAELASLCVGTFLLAGTGLLHDRSCTTHWQSVNDFRKMFPTARLIDNKIITDEHGIYTSGGANLFWNLLLYLVEKYTNRELAILASKYLIIEIERKSQSPFILFSGQKEHDDDEIRNAQEFIESHFEEKLTVDQISAKFAIGRRSLERRFKKATSNTVTEYMQRVKIEAAKKSFETSRKNINEVMQDVGYADTKAFREVFKKFTGMSPIDYRNKYNKELSASMN